MSKFWKRAAATLLLLLIFAVGAGLAFFHYATHKVAGQLKPPHLVAESTPASDLIFHTLDGQPRHLADYKGKVVFLDLWGTWCIQCVAEMPTVQKLYLRYKDNPQVVFLIVSRMDSATTVERYAHRNNYTLPFYLTRDEDVPPEMYLHQYPATFLYAKDGTLAARHAGGADWFSSSVIKFIDSLKAQ